MKKKPTNTAASVRAKLLDVANANKRAFDVVLLQYFQERFLFRLAQSQHRSKLILKGALMFRAYGIPITRPTKDIDLLGRGIGSEAKSVASIIQEIITVDCDDGVLFTPSSITMSRIKEGADYEGLRVFVEGALASARKKLQIDIGFGDLITEGPREMDYPVILNQPAPHLLVYSKETAIAEKFEAIVRLGTANSRMKDFYDILYLAQHEEFDARSLKNAITNTFSHRDTDLNQAASIFCEEFKANRTLNEMWIAFLKRAGLDQSISFASAIDLLTAFLCVVLPDGVDAVQWSARDKKWR